MENRNILNNYIKENHIKYFRVANFINKECPELTNKVKKQHIEVWVNSKAVPRENCVIRALSKLCKVEPKILLADLNKYCELKKRGAF